MKHKKEGIDYLHCVMVGALSAVIAGFLMTVSNFLRISGVNIYRLIGSAFLPKALLKGFVAPIIGFFIHTAFGIIFSIIFARFARRGKRTFFSGLMYGYMLWLIIPGALFPYLKLAPAPWELGVGTFVTTLVAFMGYGGVVASLITKVPPKETTS